MPFLIVETLVPHACEPPVHLVAAFHFLLVITASLDMQSSYAVS